MMYGWLKTVDFMKLGILVEVLGTVIFGVKVLEVGMPSSADIGLVVTLLSLFVVLLCCRSLWPTLFCRHTTTT